jgi:hypothetical protein
MALDPTRYTVEVTWPNGKVTYNSIEGFREMIRRSGMNGDFWLKKLDQQTAEAESKLCCKQP